MGTRINTMPNRPTLHEDDRVMTIFAGHRRGQSEDIARFRSAGYELETRRRKMMAFIDDQMAVIRHQVGDFAWRTRLWISATSMTPVGLRRPPPITPMSFGSISRNVLSRSTH